MGKYFLSLFLAGVNMVTEPITENASVADVLVDVFSFNK